MDLQGVADFIALAEHKSFSRAAAARHVTQPAFSRRIKALEEGLALKLVDRDTTPLTLTPAGLHFLRHAQNLAGLNSTILSDMRTLATNMPQALHIEMSNSLASSFFPAWYRRMQKQVRGLSFRLSHQRTAQTLDDLRSGLADFAVHLTVKGIRRDYDYSQLQSQTIAQDRLFFVKAPTLRHDDTSLIVHRPTSYMTPCLEKVIGAAHRAHMKVVFESPNSELSRGMALAGFGAALLQENLIADDMKDGYLVPIPGFKPLVADLVLFRPDRPLSDKAEALWEKSTL